MNTTHILWKDNLTLPRFSLRMLPWLLAGFLSVLFAVAPARAEPAKPADLLWRADKLLFCNQPERLAATGTYADYRLEAGKTYRIFWHYRNTTAQPRPLVVSFTRSDQAPFQVEMRKGIADASTDPSEAGSQAMTRYLKAPQQLYLASKGKALFPLTLKRWQVASGVLTVRANQDVRLHIYFGRDGAAVPGMQVVAVDAPRREIEVALSAKQPEFYARIGLREAGMAREMDGAYGLFYHFRVTAPAGRKVRVVFSPRGGKAGMVGTLAGRTYQSPIVEATQWAVFGEVIADAQAFFLRTAPFGGVFYPVEVAFHLME